jgi:hypothetical protein
MRLSVILVLAAPWINLAEAVLPISSHGAPDVLQAAKQLDQRNVSTFVVRAWDPSKVANDAMWNKYVSKGQHIKCIMEAPDTGAGWLEQDSRTPPSAASKWSGDLSGLFMQPMLLVVTDMCLKMPCKPGTGTRAP